MHRLTGPTVAAVALCMTVFVANSVSARDPDGRYANSPLKQWFDQLASGKGLCCSFADGVSVQDVDWDTQGGSYRVRVNGQWVVVPDAAVLKSDRLTIRDDLAGLPLVRAGQRAYEAFLGGYWWLLTRTLLGGGPARGGQTGR